MNRSQREIHLFNKFPHLQLNFLRIRQSLQLKSSLVEAQVPPAGLDTISISLNNFFKLNFAGNIWASSWKRSKTLAVPTESKPKAEE
jgi:hypothetical protein